MSFYIQDPLYQKSAYLHEALITACVGAVNGGGAYAFASKDGIELLIEDDNFKQFLKTGKFLLIVGMDDITNTYAIDTLINLQEKYRNHLSVKAYVHNSKGSTFHPKYCWFENENGGIVVLGSGNLTHKGLRQNIEAYACNTMNSSEIQKIKDEWNAWIEHSKPFLFDLNDPIVAECAKHNSSRMSMVISINKKMGKTFEAEKVLKYFDVIGVSTNKISTTSDKKDFDSHNVDFIMYDEEPDVDLPYWKFFLNSEALVAEIPKSGSRWQQVNFDKKTFEEFFGATCGENGTYRILFRNMTHDGLLNESEIRPSVSVSSQNYRFELDAAKGLDYPQGNLRPIGVFVKVAPRDFIYELVMPDDESYQDCLEVLNQRESYSSSRMRRIRYMCSEISEKTHKLAIWKRMDVEEDE